MATAEVFEPEAPVVGVPITGALVSVSVAVSVSEVDGNGGADVDGEADFEADFDCEAAVLSEVPAVGVGVSFNAKVGSCPFAAVYSPVMRFPVPPVASWKSPRESSQLLSMEIMGMCIPVLTSTHASKPSAVTQVSVLVQTRVARTFKFRPVYSLEAWRQSYLLE